MSKPSVYVTRSIPAPAIALLQRHCRVEVNPEDSVLSRAALLAKVQDRAAVLCLLTDTIDDTVLAAAGPQCRIFSNYAVGFNNIDVAAATRRGIVITNTPDVLNDATADIAWALLFAVARRVVSADRFTRAGLFRGWGPLMYLGQDITGKTLGVIGAGRIGANVAAKSTGFKMRLLYTDVRSNELFEQETGARFVSMETLLRESDFVSLHVPLLPSTHHLIGASELKLMKRTAILINTSRGPVVDEKALVAALSSGELWGAGLDVYEEEPALAPGLVECENATILPHIASATTETRTQMGMIAARNIVNVLQGELPETCVNPEVLGTQG